jgi:uncharacterized RDD family membrane protein YckC
MASLNYQGIGPRLVAQIIDGIVLIILYFVLGAAAFGAFTFNVLGFAALGFMGAYGLVFLLYFIVLEGFFGATVGKMVTKIKVVQEDGSPCGLVPSVVRNLLRIIDGLPFLYIIGMIFISRSDKKQRLGDRLAKTVVIKPSQSPSMPMPMQTPPIPPPPQDKTFCTNCGAELLGRPVFCPKCGARQ